MNEIPGYPRTVELVDGGRVELRVMSRQDRDALLTFARALPEEDLRFLRVDLTQADVVDNWMDNLARGVSHAFVANDGSGMVGYATVHRSPVAWSRHLGELRVNVSPAYRGRGLGKVLIAAIFDLARSIGLQKLSAHMMADQTGAQAAFGSFGFVMEALLADYVIDRNDRTHDMVIMSFDVAGHTDHADAPLKL